MEICFIPNRRDLIDAGRTGIKSRPLLNAIFIALFYLLPIFIALLILVFIRPINFTYVVVPLLIPVAMHFLMRGIMLQHQGSPSLKGEHRYVLTDKEVELIGPGFDNRIAWDMLTKCTRSKTTYLFYSAKTPVISIPLRALSDEQEEQLDSILAAKGL